MKVFRGDSSGGEFVDYTVDADEGQVVLDVINEVRQREGLPGLPK